MFLLITVLVFGFSLLGFLLLFDSKIGFMIFMFPLAFSMLALMHIAVYKVARLGLRYNISWTAISCATGLAALVIALVVGQGFGKSLVIAAFVAFVAWTTVGNSKQDEDE